MAPDLAIVSHVPPPSYESARGCSRFRLELGQVVAGSWLPRLFDVFDYFGLTVCAVATFATTLLHILFTRDRDQVVVGVNPGVGQHRCYFVGGHVAN